MTFAADKKSMRHMRSPGGKKLVRLLVTLLMFALGITMLVPFFWMLSASFKKPIDVFQYPIVWIPAYWYPDNYREVWQGNYSFAMMYWNSAKVTLFSVVGAVFMSSMAGYAFARLRFAGRDKLFLLYIATLIIPLQATMVPRYMVYEGLSIINTHLSLILPALFTPFGVFLMRQFYVQIPMELSEAAYIDGAGELRTWIQIIMPLTKPAMMTMLILAFTWSWNDYENPLIFLRSKELLTLPIGLSLFRDENVVSYTLVMAAASLSVLPIFAVFLIGQKYFVDGMVSGAVKG